MTGGADGLGAGGDAGAVRERGEGVGEVDNETLPCARNGLGGSSPPASSLAPCSTAPPLLPSFECPLPATHPARTHQTRWMDDLLVRGLVGCFRRRKAPRKADAGTFTDIEFTKCRKSVNFSLFLQKVNFWATQMTPLVPV